MLDRLRNERLRHVFVARIPGLPDGLRILMVASDRSRGARGARYTKKARCRDVVSSAALRAVGPAGRMSALREIVLVRSVGRGQSVRMCAMSQAPATMTR